MTLKDDLIAKVHEFAATRWPEIPNGNVVPSPENLTQGNTGKRINATVLYADMDGSTNMVDDLLDTHAAEYYKAFLHCAAKIIRANGGAITAYDGDRVMGIYVGGQQAPNAVTTALQINWAVRELVNPLFASVYTSSHRPVRHTVGIDCGRLLAAKTGVRDDNDLVWIGPAANYAAKLNSFEGLDNEYQTRATERFIASLGINYFTRSSTGTSIWDGPYSNLTSVSHYRTDCTMEVP